MMSNINQQIKALIHKSFRFIKNTYKYRKFLKEDCWWDSYYIFLMLREKLSIDVKGYKQKSFNTDVGILIEKMGLCIKLLDRILKNDYLENSLMFYEKEYPNWLISRQNIPDIKWFRRCGRMADRQRQQDIDYLFKCMSKHIQRWWD